MKTCFRFLWLVIIIPVMTACGGKYSYETVAGDPLEARIYTLDNGLKVYMTVNKVEPRIQTYIAVRVGGKNDPSETTGLAHYFEHLMFKGTESFGTQNYALEKPLLDEIEKKFEYYRGVDDPGLREKIYAEIDSLSFEASKYAIPNEYDKLMASIGAKGSNAYTGYDMTVYTEDIPSNQVENWARIQSDRFKHNVIRGFHTELEAVYEEKNMSLTNDMQKALAALLSALYPHHPYGTQTVLGTQEHLKNPSITNIKKYYHQWYVPNNMAICLSGDFDPDRMIAVIDRYFGDMQPNKDLKRTDFEPEAPVEGPVRKEVFGLESPYIMMGWRFPGASSAQADTLSIVSSILSNGNAGLLDQRVIRAQRILGGYAGVYDQSDYNTFLMQGYPKEGQSLEEVENILLEQLEELKQGRFSDSLLTAILNNDKRARIQRLERNSGRADLFVDAFINGIPWKQEVEEPQRIAGITKSDIVEFANRHFQNNYVAVSKLQGKDTSVVKMPKPKITPILTNRDTASLFLREIQASVPAPIEPVFLDFSKDLEQLVLREGGPELLYKKNVSNDLFSLSYIFDMGNNEDKGLALAMEYLDYLGAGSLTADRINDEFYRMACSYDFNVTSDKVVVSLSGLQENMAQSLELLESLLNDARPDEKALENLKKDVLLSRSNAKLNQSENFTRLYQYIAYGPNNPMTSVLSGKEIMQMTPDKLINRIKELQKYQHTILYYGPAEKDSLVAVLQKEHRMPESLKPVPENESIKMQPVKENAVYLAPYDAKQIYMVSYSNDGKLPDAGQTPIIRLYNEYFGSGMNSVVFQEMREARGLAYSANARYVIPSRANDPYTYMSFIATQNDKMMDAINAFDEIINNMPQSGTAFAIARENLLGNLRTERIRGAQVLSYYLSAREMGLDYDIRREVFDKVQNLTLEDVVKFQQENVKDRMHRTGILGDEKDLDIQSLGNGTRGRIIRLTTEDIFGY